MPESELKLAISDLTSIWAQFSYCTNVSSDLRSIHLPLNNGTLHFPFVTYYFSFALCNSLNYNKYICFYLTRINVPTHNYLFHFIFHLTILLITFIKSVKYLNWQQYWILINKVFRCKIACTITFQNMPIV